MRLRLQSTLFILYMSCDSLFKSNEHSEDSCIGLGDFLFVCFFLMEKVLKCSKNYRCAFILINAFMNTLR